MSHKLCDWTLILLLECFNKSVLNEYVFINFINRERQIWNADSIQKRGLCQTMLSFVIFAVFYIELTTRHFVILEDWNWEISHIGRRAEEGSYDWDQPAGLGRMNKWIGIYIEIHR